MFQEENGEHTSSISAVVHAVKKAAQYSIAQLSMAQHSTGGGAPA